MTTIKEKKKYRIVYGIVIFEWLEGKWQEEDELLYDTEVEMRAKLKELESNL